MSEMIIRPTMKFIYLGYVVVIVIVAASVVALMRIAMAAADSAGLAALDSLVARAPSAVAVETPSPQPPDQDDDPR